MSSDVIRTLKWVFGKGGLIEEYKRQEQMLEETPKSVASMTRIFAPQISRDFPGMNLEQFEALAQQQLVAALQAVSAGNLESVARASDELKEQVSRQIEGNRAAGVRETYEQIRIHQTEISNYEKKNGTCVITFQSAVEHYHYKEKAGKIIWGYKDRKLQTKYNMELLYVQDAAQQTEGNAFGLNCPNCGAPAGENDTVCAYCDSSLLIPEARTWVVPDDIPASALVEGQEQDNLSQSPQEWMK